MAYLSTHTLFVSNVIFIDVLHCHFRQSCWVCSPQSGTLSFRRVRRPPTCFLLFRLQPSSSTVRSGAVPPLLQPRSVEQGGDPKSDHQKISAILGLARPRQVELLRLLAWPDPCSTEHPTEVDWAPTASGA